MAVQSGRLPLDVSMSLDSPVLDDTGHSEARMGPLDAVVHARLFHYLPSTLMEGLTTLLLLLLFNPGVRPGRSTTV